MSRIRPCARCGGEGRMLESLLTAPMMAMILCGKCGHSVTKFIRGYEVTLEEQCRELKRLVTEEWNREEREDADGE